MKKNSFTLIEVIISIFFLTTGIITVAGVISYTFIPFSIANQRLTALYLAQEGIEIIRNIKDTNYLEINNGLSTSWNQGLTSCENGCEVDYQTVNNLNPSLSPFGVNGRYLCINNEGFFGYDNCQQTTTFKRKITIHQIGDNILEISAEVSWQERGRTHKVKTQEIIYNW